MKPGDIIKIKLGGDIHEAEVVNCHNRKTIRVRVLWSKTRLQALTPEEKEVVAGQPQNLEGLSEEEKILASLARIGKKVVHERGSKTIKIPRAKVVTELTTSEVQTAPAAESTPEVCRESRLEHLTTDVSTQPTTTVQVTDFTPVEPVVVLSAKDRLKAKLSAKKGGD